MALSSFIANCFNYLWVSKMKPICIPQIFYEDSEFINHYRQKTSFIFFIYLKLQNFEIVGLFIPQELWAEYILLKNASVIDHKCQHRSAVKNKPPPFLSLPVPIPPPHRTHHPSANCPGPTISGLLDPVTSSANGVAPLAQSIEIRSVPFQAPPPLLPSARKTGSSSGEKGFSLSEGLGKEYMKWCKRSVGKTGTQAVGRHVVIRASQG